MRKLFSLAIALLMALPMLAYDNYLPGSWNEWSTSNDGAKFVDGKLTLALAANTTYEFKLFDTNGDVWRGNTGTMTESNCKRWKFDSDSNCKIKTTVAGEYVFTVLWDNNGPHISVTYPSDYAELEYIEFKGNDKSRTIHTNYIPNTNTEIRIKFRAYTSSNGWRAIFSGRNTGAGTGMSMYVNGNNSNIGYFTGGTTGGGDQRAPLTLNEDYTAVCTVGNLKLNGTDYATGETTCNATTRDITLFSNPEWDQSFEGRIYYFDIYEGSTQLHHFVPSMSKSTGAIGFYDTIDKTFTVPTNTNGFSGAKLSTETYLSVPALTKVFKSMTGTAAVTIDSPDRTLADYTATWTSEDENIATVANDGTITGVAVGTTTLKGVFVGPDTWTLYAPVEVLSNTIAADQVVTWNGTDDAILPSAKWSGDAGKPAYTWVVDSNKGYDGAYFNHVWGTPSKDDASHPWYSADYVMTNDMVASWNYNNTVIPQGWPGNMSDVYVRRYFKAEGTLPEHVFMPAPHDDAPCEYYINGVLVWSRTGYESNVDGWYEDEVVRLTPEEKALIKTDGSVNVFAYHVHQNWGGRYADGGLYGNSYADNTPSKKFRDNDDSRLRLENALYQAVTLEGMDIDARLKNAPNCLQDRSWALDNLRLQLKNKLARHNDYSTLASATPADGLECWLYNVGTGQFLAGGNDWGTHASVNANLSSWPMVLRANSSGANRFAIQTNLPNGTRGANDGLGHNGYVDCGYGSDFTTAQGWAWEFQAVGDGTYRIINCDNGGDNKYLGVSEDARYQVDTDKRGADNPNNRWKVISRAQLEQMYADATSAKPADVTYKIHQNTFSQNDFDGNKKGDANADLNDSKWERNAGSIWNWKGNDAGGDYVFEVWNHSGDFKLHQTIEGLRPGKYTVSCQGFYRDGNWDSAVAGNERKLAYLYAGTEENKVLLPNIIEGANRGAGYGRLDNMEKVIADGCKDVAKFFQYGNYQVSVDVVVGTDGVLDLGVARPGAGVKEKDWVVVDNFRLEYLGGDVVPVGEAGWATYVAPKTVDLSGVVGKGGNAYTVKSVENGYITLGTAKSIEKGIAIVVEAAQGEYFVEGCQDASMETNVLVAATENVTADGTQYILAKVGEKVGFSKATVGSTIAAGKGYLVIPAAAKAFFPFGEGEATEIEGVIVEQNDGSYNVYNLAGQKLQNVQKGVNIINGKKVVIK